MGDRQGCWEVLVLGVRKKLPAHPLDYGRDGEEGEKSNILKTTVP